jgi:hypothetical protein
MVQVAEPRQQRLGERFGVPARDRAVEDHLEQLVIRHRIRAALA